MGKIFGGGSSSTTVVNQPAPRSQEENDLLKQQVEIARFQLDELKKASASNSEFNAFLKPLIELQGDILKGVAADTQSQREEQRLINERTLKFQQENKEQLDRQYQTQLDLDTKQLALTEKSIAAQMKALENAGKPTEQETALINDAVAAALQSGEVDINRFQTDALTALAQELAPALGLKPTDTAILDRGGKIAAEALRSKSSLSADLRAAQANAGLSFPLARDQLISSISGFQQNLAESTAQFKEQLRQSALINRANLGLGLGSPAVGQQQFGLGIAGGLGGINAGLGNISQILRAGAGSTTTTTGTTPFNLGGLGGLFGGLGGLGTGLRAVGLIGSDIEMKEEIIQVDPGEIADAIMEMPTILFKYKDSDGVQHIGTTAQDWQQRFGVGDGKTINIVDALGILFATSKALVRRVKDIEHGGHGSRPETGLRLAA